MPKVIKLKQHKVIPQKTKVAAYARVSRESERSSHSLAAQVSYYSNYIQTHPEWEYAGVYIDSFIPGGQTKHRKGFNDLVADCESGKVDLVLVKSISRFARNTVDLLNTVRHLKDLGVAVIFEKEHINTLSSDGEFMLTVLASFAQEELMSMSNNIKWAFTRKFQNGLPHHNIKVLGYDWQGENLVINLKEADIIKTIFALYIGGSSLKEITEKLNSEHPDMCLDYQRVGRVIENEIYIGRLIMQKTYSQNPISKRRMTNMGERPFYIVEAHHEPIISLETFEAAKAEKQRRIDQGCFWNRHILTSPLTGKIKCGCCGSTLVKDRRYPADSQFRFWHCKNNADCGNEGIPDKIIQAKLTELIGNCTNNLQKVIVYKDTLSFAFMDGKTMTSHWELENKDEAWRYTITKGNPKKTYCFTSTIRCGVCGGNYRRRNIYSSGRHGWSCPKGKSGCGIRWIREDELKSVMASALGLSEFDESQYREQVDHIIVNSNEELTIYFKNGLEKVVHWNSRRTYENAENSKNNPTND